MCASITSNIIHDYGICFFVKPVIKTKRNAYKGKKSIFDLNRRARPLVLQEVFQDWRATPHFWRDDRRTGKKLPRALDILYKLALKLIFFLNPVPLSP